MKDQQDRWPDVVSFVKQAMAGRSLISVANEAKVSDKTLAKYMRDEPYRGRSATEARIGKVLGVEADWVDLILRGWEPPLLPPPGFEAEVAELRERVRTLEMDVRLTTMWSDASGEAAAAASYLSLVGGEESPYEQEIANIANQFDALKSPEAERMWATSRIMYERVALLAQSNEALLTRLNELEATVKAMAAGLLELGVRYLPPDDDEGQMPGESHTGQ